MKNSKTAMVLHRSPSKSTCRPTDKTWLNATFLKALKDGVKVGDFTQVKNSYKLSAEYKKKVATALKPKKAPKKKVVSSHLYIVGLMLNTHANSLL